MPYVVRALLIPGTPSADQGPSVSLVCLIHQTGHTVWIASSVAAQNLPSEKPRSFIPSAEILPLLKSAGVLQFISTGPGSNVLSARLDLPLSQFLCDQGGTPEPPESQRCAEVPKVCSLGRDRADNHLRACAPLKGAR